MLAVDGRIKATPGLCVCINPSRMARQLRPLDDMIVEIGINAKGPMQIKSGSYSALLMPMVTPLPKGSLNPEAVTPAMVGA